VSLEGIGIFYCRRSLLKRLSLVLVGWNTVRDASSYHKINFQPKSNAGRFEEGSQNQIGIHALTASIRFLQSVGIERIEQWILHLTDLLLKGLKGRGLWILSSTIRSDRSSIISFSTGNKAKDKALVHRLVKYKIILSLRADGIRLSPHLYNTPAETAKFFRILDEFL
jgi:selenocysteine lyase/cysteine desulfurase